MTKKATQSILIEWKSAIKPLTSIKSRRLALEKDIKRLSGELTHFFITFSGVKMNA